MGIFQKKFVHVKTNQAQLELACSKIERADKEDTTYFSNGDVVYIRSDSIYYLQQEQDANWYSGEITKSVATYEDDHPYYVSFRNGSANYYNSEDLIHAALVLTTDMKNRDLSFLLKESI